MRTILNIGLAPRDFGASPAESIRHPAGPSLFRNGEAASEDGAWSRWGWAVLVATIVHAGALAVGLSAPRAEAMTPPPPREPELVLFTFAPPPPAPASAAPEKAQRQARARVPRPELVVPKPKPVVEPKPEPVVEQAPEETPQPPEDVEVEVASVGTAGTGGEGAVIGGVAGGVAGGRVGGLVGATGSEALELKQVSRAPAVLKQVTPDYPRRARSQGIEGLVLVRLIIGADGRVEPDSTRILRSVPELDAAAIAAVSQWRFSPALGRTGQPVRVIVEIPVQFSLK